MPTKRPKTRKPRRARGLAAYPPENASHRRHRLASDAASERRCLTAISGYGEQRTMGEHEEAAHVFQDIIKFYIRPQDRK